MFETVSPGDSDQEARHVALRSKITEFLSGCRVGDPRFMAFNDAYIRVRTQDGISRLKSGEKVWGGNGQSDLRVHEGMLAIIKVSIQQRRAEIPGYDGDVDLAESLLTKFHTLLKNGHLKNPKKHDADEFVAEIFDIRNGVIEADMLARQQAHGLRGVGSALIWIVNKLQGH